MTPEPLRPPPPMIVILERRKRGKTAGCFEARSILFHGNILVDYEIPAPGPARYTVRRLLAEHFGVAPAALELSFFDGDLGMFVGLPPEEKRN